MVPTLPRFLVFAALAALTFGAALTPAGAQDKQPNPVKVTAEAAKPDDKGVQTITLTVQIDKPYHLYANPVGNMDLEAAQTTVKFVGKNKPEEVVKIEYPEGKTTKDKVVGDYRTYEDKAVIKATVRRAKGDAGPLEIEVSYQACTDKSCLQPAKAKVTVP